MNLKNAQVLLTINLEGAHKPWFVKTTTKEGKEKLRRVFNPDLNPGRDCRQVILLSEEFVNHAISFEGRVSAKLTFAFNNWRKLTAIQRLEANLAELVSYLGGQKFIYKLILEEES